MLHYIYLSDTLIQSDLGLDHTETCHYRRDLFKNTLEKHVGQNSVV